MNRVAKVVSVARDGTHGFSKPPVDRIDIMAGLGVKGDAHCGSKVLHLSRIRVDPDQPNLRQVHLIASELFYQLAAAGFTLHPGQLGENVTTRGLDLLSLPRHSQLKLGDNVVLQITGLRNPCAQIEAFRPGLLAQVLQTGPDGGLIRKAGIMAVVLRGGAVRPCDAIIVTLPASPHLPLERV